MGKILKDITKHSAFLLLIFLIIVLVIYQRNKRSEVVESPAITRLTAISDSLLFEVKLNNQRVLELRDSLDSIVQIQNTIIQTQPIVNRFYNEEVTNILNSGYGTSLSQLDTTLKSCDSKFKHGFYSYTLKLRNSTDQPE